MFTSPQEEKFFLSYIKPHHRVLEYGSGASTKQIAQIASCIYSIEHQKSWYDNLYNSVKDCKNIELVLKIPNLPFEECGHDGNYETFKDYVEAPKDKFPFDIILIDGRARSACAKFISQHCNNNTLVFIHDYNTGEPTRHMYIDALKWFNIIDFIDTMYLFKKKNESMD